MTDMFLMMEWDKNKKIFLEIICIVFYFSFAIGMS